jgi:hypothetical protein
MRPQKQFIHKRNSQFFYLFFYIKEENKTTILKPEPLIGISSTETHSPEQAQAW